MAALLTLALGVGANTAIFSVAYGVLFRPLPYEDPAGLVRISESHPGANPPLAGAWFSNFTYHAWQPTARSVGPIATYVNTTSTVGLDAPARIGRARVSPSLFAVLGVAPVAGRFFVEADGLPDAAPVAVLAPGLWRERFGAGPFEPGRILDIDGETHDVVGLAPAGLAFPSSNVTVWTADPLPPPTGVNVFGAIARLSPGVTPALASAEATRAAQATERPPAANLLYGEGGPVVVRVETMAREMTSEVRPALLVLLAGAGCLLLIACANVANLFLSRGVSRERELALRAALGASRGRLLRQLLTEHAVVAAIGGLAGVVLAAVMVRALPALAPERFPRLDDVRLDGVALAFAVAATMLAGVLAGLGPAWRGSRHQLAPALRDGAGGSAGGRLARVRRLLLAGEAAVAVVLLIAAALLGRSFVALASVDGGFDADRVLIARIHLPGSARGEAETDTFVTTLLERLRARPDVVAAGAGSMAPFGLSTSVSRFTVAVPGREPVTARSLLYIVTPGYAEALRLTQLGGRLLEDGDRTAAVESLLVNDAFVRAFLDGVEPVGVRFDGIFDPGVTAEIVGVVGNVLKDGMDRAPQPEVYVTTARRLITREINLVVRTAGEPLALAADLRREVQALDASAAIDGLRRLDDAVSTSIGEPRFAMTVLAGFAALALGLAATGLYSVLSYAVSRRRREIGIRSALGATRGRLIGLVLREGLIVTAAGLAAGVAAAALLTRWMQSLLFGIAPFDPLSFVAAPVMLLVVAMLACWLPARRAAATNVVSALKND